MHFYHKGRCTADASALCRRYSGQWKDGIREGHGKLTWPDGSWYEGEFQHNCIEGQGKKVGAEIWGSAAAVAATYLAAEW